MRKTTRQQLPSLGIATTPSALERLAIIHMPIDSIIPNPSNPRKHSRQQLRAIARSIEKFGFATPSASIARTKSFSVTAGSRRRDCAAAKMCRSCASNI